MKENKISIEITADGWKTDVTINGKTYSERHIGHYGMLRYGYRNMPEFPPFGTNDTTKNGKEENRHHLVAGVPDDA